MLLPSTEAIYPHKRTLCFRTLLLKALPDFLRYSYATEGGRVQVAGFKCFCWAVGKWMTFSIFVSFILLHLWIERREKWTCSCNSNNIILIVHIHVNVCVQDRAKERGRTTYRCVYIWASVCVESHTFNVSFYLIIHCGKILQSPIKSTTNVNTNTNKKFSYCIETNQTNTPKQIRLHTHAGSLMLTKIHVCIHTRQYSQ